jgi:hypothetical protein
MRAMEGFFKRVSGVTLKTKLHTLSPFAYVITYLVNDLQKLLAPSGFTHFAWPTKIVVCKIEIPGLESTSASQ